MRARLRFTLALCLLPWLYMTDDTFARDLTFEDRVKTQEAIERVYFAHQIGTTRPFEDVVTRDLLEEKVKTYLKQSVALEKFWHTPITAEMMRAEQKRMARQTRMPERLRELYTALGDDQWLIQECLARPLLADRLVRNFLAFDLRIQADARRKADVLRARLASGRLSPADDHLYKTVVDMVQAEPGERRKPDATVSALSIEQGQIPHATLSEKEFQRLSARLSPEVGDVGAVVEEQERFIIQIALERQRDRIRVANYVVPKESWDTWWHEVSDDLEVDSIVPSAPLSEPLPTPVATMGRGWAPETGVGSFDVAEESQAGSLCANDSWDISSQIAIPDPRNKHTAVWTGTIMIVWGGVPDSPGGRYDPATDTWTPMSNLNAPHGRYAHTAIWTGTEMVVWGGYSDLMNSYFNTGGKYDPVKDTWTATSIVDAPTSRAGHSVVWTGRVMLVWGGQDGVQILGTGAQYDPSADTWMAVNDENAPSPRRGHTAIWSGRYMVVWGGIGNNAFPLQYVGSGGRYDPDTDSWAPISMSNAPSPRTGHTAVWTGSLMIVWGGAATSVLNTGGLYNPAIDAWTSTQNVFGPRERHTAIWTGSFMVVWGGRAGPTVLNTGFQYNPTNNTWLPMPMSNAPAARVEHTAVWTGSLMIVWGGLYQNRLNTGGRYDPSSQTWTPTSRNVPAARRDHSAVWTGTHMVIWGGFDGTSVLNSGARYDPAADVWRPTSTAEAPAARQSHTAIWAGAAELMLIWGGSNQYTFPRYPQAGARYDPFRDAWIPISVLEAPTGRSLHTAVWTGDSMIIWGGYDDASFQNTGGRYDPLNNVWTQMSGLDAPSGRAFHSAVWTGSQMVVWGGLGEAELNSGGRYDPVSDTWLAMSTSGAPEPRGGHTAVWTGNMMIVWGGGIFSAVGTGGRYDPTADAWQPASTIAAPAPRSGHSAVWTENVMVVWGGEPGQSGGQYDPIADNWTPISLINAPSDRVGHTAVWIGNMMLVWGGFTPFDSYFNNGGGYCPCAVTTYYLDADGDGHGQLDTPFQFCTAPFGYVSNADDCDDTDPTIHPVAVETCDGADDDCNGHIDEGFEVGTECAGDLDECHQVIGVLQCSLDGMGTRCVGDETFHDAAPPVLSCPSDLTRECPASSGSIGFPIVTDACDPNPLVMSNAPASLPPGERLVTWFATDASGNRSSCDQTISVVDTQPPEISIRMDPGLLWPPNHRLVTVQAAWEVSDACDTEPRLVLVSAASSEPDDAAGTGDGNTTVDIQDASIGLPDDTVRLRAERLADGTGRAYTLTYAAQDASGNTSSALGMVTVPHDTGTGPEPVVLSVEGGGTPGMAHLYWNAVNGAESYDVIQGNLSQVTEANGLSRLGPVLVLAAGQVGTSLSEGIGGATPTVGSAFFYLVQYRERQQASGWGTESSPWPAEPSSCDIDCPGDPVASFVASTTPKRK